MPTAGFEADWATDEEEELGSRKGSLEHLICEEEEEEEEAGPPQRSGHAAAEDSELDEFPPDGEQVDDFAGSVLAAISFWRCTVTMVTVRLSAAGPRSAHHPLTRPSDGQRRCPRAAPR